MDKLSLEESLNILIPSEQIKTKSPVRIPKVIDVNNEEIDEIDEPAEDMYSTYTVETEESTSKNLTPKRFKVEAPKTPKRKILNKEKLDDDNEQDVYDLLKDYRLYYTKIYLRRR